MIWTSCKIKIILNRYEPKLYSVDKVKWRFVTQPGWT